jgi:PKD repeat protein
MRVSLAFSLRRRLAIATLLFAVLACLGRARSAPPEFRRGDVEADSRLTITDAVRVLGFLFLGNPSTLECEDAADADDSGVVNITDPILVLAYLFLGGNVLPEPFEVCGTDPSEDGLSCAEFPACAIADLPRARIVSDIRAGVAPLSVFFDASESTSPSGEIVAWEWSFDDGSAAAGIQVEHTYSRPGTYLATLRVFDDAGESARTSRRIIVYACRPEAPIIDPHSTHTADDAIVLTGRAAVGTVVEIETPAGVFDVVAADGRFVARIPLSPARPNSVHLVSLRTRSDCGTPSSPAFTSITHDTLGPRLFIDSPADGARIAGGVADVAGRVGDVLSGSLGLVVSVNGVDAAVDVGIGPNGSFLARDVPIGAGGPIELVAIAADALGNSSERRITVQRDDGDPRAARIEFVAGNGQSAPMRALLPEPIAIRVTRANGEPFSGKLVTFEVTRSDGDLSTDGFDSSGLFLQAFTDDGGLARVRWRLGTDAGCGNNRVVATSRGVHGEVGFCASSLPGPAVQINIGSGQSQRVEVGGPALEPLRVWVSDGCNGVVGAPVTFTVRAGAGLVEGAPARTVETDATGHAEVRFVLGPTALEHVIEADFDANPRAPVRFVLSGVVREARPLTTFTGLVLDNAQRPIQGAVCRIVVPGEIVPPVRSDADGQFRFTSRTLSGLASIWVEGLFATHLAGREIPLGSFPSLHFETVITPLSENSLATPVLLPPLDPRNTRVYDGTRDVDLTVAGVEGLRMRIRAGSMRLADGRRPSRGEPAVVALNQVHHDDIPMPMPDGAAPPFAWTLQPSGAMFDPPVEIVYPNMSGLAPGAVAYFLSFDHDTSRFEIIASGRVSADGAEIASDPGVGITTAGWGCNCPPYSVTGSCTGNDDDGDDDDDEDDDDDDEDDDDDDDAECVEPCDDGDPCRVNDRCIGTVCQGESPLPPCSGFPPIPVNYDWPTEESAVGTNRNQRLDEGFIDAPCVDKAAGVWRRLPTEINSYGIAFYSNVGSIDPDPRVGGNVGLCPPEPGQHCYCEIIADLRDYKGDPGTGQGTWHTLEASRVHEQYHATVDTVALFEPHWAATEILMRIQGVPCVVPPDVARDLLADINDALFVAMQAAFLTSWNEFSDQHNAPPYDDGAYCAGQAVLDAEIAGIEAFAAAQGFPPCGFEAPLRRWNPAAPGGVEDPRLVALTATVPVSVLDPGELIDVTVEGLFADGTTRDLSSAASGTTYRSGNSAVAAIDSEGRITALSPGIGLIVAEHAPGAGGDLSVIAALPIRVRFAHDHDGDLLPNGYELDQGLDPEDPSDARADRDGDGLSELEEFFRSTDPTVDDSDGDGVTDGREVESGGNPRTPMRIDELDQSWVLVAGGQVARPRGNGSFRIDNIPAADLIGLVPGGPPDFLSDDPVRIVGSSTRNGVTRWVVSEPFRIRQGESHTVESLTYLTTPPPGLPESLALTADRGVLNAIGDTIELRVSGRTSDFDTEDLTAASRLTVYRASNPARLSVSRDGVARLVSPREGDVFVTATNQGATAVLRLRVELPTRRATIVGFVELEDGSRVAGAEVGILGDVTTVESAADGSFSLETVVSERSEVELRARAELEGRVFSGLATSISIGTGAFTDAGVIVIEATCPASWDAAFLRSSQSSSPVFALETFDDGSGPALWAAGAFVRIGGVFVQRGVARWDGIAWRAADTGVFPGLRVLAVLDLDDGEGPTLYGGGTGVWRWNGSEWNELGARHLADVHALAVFDGGAGPALHAGTRGGVASWDGAAWTLVAPGWSDRPYALAVFDDGERTALYTAGLALQSNGESIRGVASWDGSRWSSLGTGLSSPANAVRGALALAVFDDGSGPSLFAGGEFTHAGAVEVNGVARWDGASWHALNTGVRGALAEIASFAVFDDGSGAKLWAAGRFVEAGGSPAAGMARWNGMEWAALGSDLSAIYVWSIEPFDDGSGPALYFAGQFTDPVGAGGGLGVARWRQPLDCR